MLRVATIIATIMVVLGQADLSLGIDNGLGLRPPMGWRDWTTMGGAINQATMELAMMKMSDRKRVVPGVGGTTTRRSFVDLGYTRVGLDDAWQKCGAGVNGSFHDKDGIPIVDTDKFPDMKSKLARRAVFATMRCVWTEPGEGPPAFIAPSLPPLHISLL